MKMYGPAVYGKSQREKKIFNKEENENVHTLLSGQIDQHNCGQEFRAKIQCKNVLFHGSIISGHIAVKVHVFVKKGGKEILTVYRYEHFKQY